MKRIVWPPALQPTTEFIMATITALLMVIFLVVAGICGKTDNVGIAIPLGALAVVIAGFGYSGASRLHLRRWRCLRRFVTEPRCAGRVVAIETVELPKAIVAAHPTLRAVTCWHRDQQGWHEDALDFLVQPADGSAPSRVAGANLTVLVETTDPKPTRNAGIAADELVVVAGDLGHEPHPVGETAGYREPPKRAVYSNAVAIQVADLDTKIPTQRPLMMAIGTLLLFAVLGLGSFAVSYFCFEIQPAIPSQTKP